MLYLECEVRRPVGLRDTDVIAVVTDHTGVTEQIEIEKSFLVQRAGRDFLPVWGLAHEHAKSLVEIELPQESASGTNRLWVKANQVFYQKEEVPA